MGSRRLGLLLIAGVLVLAGCSSTPQVSTEVESASDQILLQKIARGDLDDMSEMERIVDVYGAIPFRSLLCDWVRQGRREVVSAWLNRATRRQGTDLPKKVPLLACVNSAADYAYYRSLGATNGRYGRLSWLGQTSLHDAVANGNALAVSQHLKDGVSPEILLRGMNDEYWHTALDHALRVREFMLRGPQNERHGIWPGVVHVAWHGADGFGPAEVYRYNPTLREGWERSIRILLESGANIRASTAHATGMALMLAPRTETLEQRFGADEFFQRSIRLAQDIRKVIPECRESRKMEACQKIVGLADPLSVPALDAKQLLAEFDRNESDWAQAQASQACRLLQANLLYLGTACQNNLANGIGQARSRDGWETFSGTFKAGRFVHGRYSRGGQPSFEGAWVDGQAEGPGVCWHEGVPEECGMSKGQRIDTLHIQRQALERQRKDLETQRQAQEEQRAAARRVAEQDARRSRDRAEMEAADERRQQKAIAAAAGGRTGNAALDDTLGFVERMNQTTRAGLAEIDRTRIERQRNEATLAARERELAVQAQAAAQRQLAQQTAQKQQTQAAPLPKTAGTVSPGRLVEASRLGTGSVPEVQAVREPADESCITSVGWCAGGDQLVENASGSLTVRVANGCPHRLYTQICMEMRDGRTSCESHGHAAGRPATASFGKDEATGRYTVQSVGSTQSEKDWVCSARVPGWNRR